MQKMYLSPVMVARGEKADKNFLFLNSKMNST